MPYDKILFYDRSCRFGDKWSRHPVSPWTNWQNKNVDIQRKQDLSFERQAPIVISTINLAHVFVFVQWLGCFYDTEELFLVTPDMMIAP
jgi:hypothetical protein